MSLSGLIEQHVRTRPEATAVTYPSADGRGVSLTYRELSAAANRLAAHLEALGVVPGDRVVTALGPGPHLVTAFLAVVRAGAAYVPVDPGHPELRRRLIVRDSAARAVVTEGGAAGGYAGLDAVAVDLDADAGPIAARSADLPAVRPAPGDAAYVCYTSGTTGTPKGVVVPHRAVLDLVASTDYVRLTPDDVVAQAANPAFDAVTFEIWSTLAAGARLVGLAKETVVDPARFAAAVREHEVSTVFLTTALFHQIARERPGAFAPLRTVLFGGEACDPRRVRQVLAAGGPGRLLHVYGPTETTTFATWHEVTGVAPDARTVPIGRPLGATVAVVVSADGSPAAPGGVGELLLGGPGLATGYLDRPELTAQRFVEDRFTPGGGLLYRTGDLVRLREDGAMEFTGRVDSQVKLRGFRIELGEIESVLTAHPAVSEAVVSVHTTAEPGEDTGRGGGGGYDGSAGGGGGGERRLVAHVVPAVRRVAARESEQLTEWKEIYETLYDDAGEAAFGENFAGWNSSYDARPIALEEMRQWRAATVERVRELGGRRVLEIGVGTGLLMARLAGEPECEEYWATDFSASVIEALRVQTGADERLRGKVRLSCRGADDLEGLPTGYFDTVVVNSVLQYFPGPAYLRTVVEGVLPLLAPGGSVLLGDVRNLDLASCLQTGVELAARAGRPEPADGADVWRAVEQRVALETELLLSPALFAAWAGELPAVRAVDVRVKRGGAHNELTRYRYEAVLSTAAPVADLSGAPRLVWGREAVSAADVEAYLRARRPAAVRLAGVPNRRVHGEWAAMRALREGAAGAAGAAALLADGGGAPDPEELCAAGERAGYRALPTWSAEEDRLLDVVFVDPGQVPAGPLTGVYAAPVVAAGDCANTPTAFRGTVDTEVVLRAHLQERLPNYMIPSALMTLAALPLNANGKVDRAALPAPAFSADRPGTPPGTPLQEIVRDLFAEVIGVPRRTVHADSDFFRIGGHSLAAARLLARARAVLGADPGSRALYEAPTPALFAALVGDGPAEATGPGRAGAGEGCAVLPLRLRGALSVRALEEALGDLGRRHEALRNSRLGSAGTRLRTLAADDHLLELTLPAGLVDLWSHTPLAAELALAYGARATGGAPHRDGGAPEAAPRALDGDLAPTAVPGSGPAAAGGPDGGRLGLDWDAGLHERLVRLATEQGVTLFMVVHAALAALLARLGAGDVVTLAAPVPARDSAALRRAVGPYGRVLALSVDTSGDPAFTELLRRVRAADLAAYRGGGAALARPGGIALSVLAESCAEYEAAGLTVQAAAPQLPAQDAGLDLTLTERQTPAGAPAGITVSAAFDHGSVGEAAAARLTGLLTALLEAAADAPATVLSRLRTAPGAPSDGVRRWAGPALDLPEAGVADLFAAQAARTPGAPALAGMDYAELDARSDLLAHALLAHRAGPGTAVATAVASPTGFAVAVLAIAKTGAACLPLDPARALPALARPAVLLLDEAADRALAPVPGAARLVRDPAADLLPATPARPVRPPHAAHTAHPLVLAPATRDTTGTADAGGPAGTGGPADALVEIGAESVVAATLAPAADAAWLTAGYPDADTALGLLAALAGGARVHLPAAPPDGAAPDAVLELLRGCGASVLLGGDTTTATAGTAAAAGAGDLAPSVPGGWPEGRLRVEHTPDGPRPAPGHRAYVLDAHLRPAGDGRTGSLYIAGVGVARGYTGDPAATGERFLPDPLAGPGGTALMWRTGRGARIDADGRLTVLGKPPADDPFTDEYATFVVLSDDRDRHALWPACVPAPEGWHETHAEDLYELCLDHLQTTR
ncbi:amino acid adenylation domain-containing protein [Streptomyces sp. NPDC058108]|uniref:amino acid adenylation domain-containing protein n=1 Tax=Streptomyces sp. NPDC058108 TaxID=3346344 RepID=UPI0036ECE40E